jgi:hypothetical protein
MVVVRSVAVSVLGLWVIVKFGVPSVLGYVYRAAPFLKLVIRFGRAMAFWGTLSSGARCLVVSLIEGVVGVGCTGLLRCGFVFRGV